MAKKTIYSCDGCDKKAETIGNSQLPEGWRVVVIMIDNVGDHVSYLNKESKYDLCWQCQRSLANHLPSNWVRCKP